MMMKRLLRRDTRGIGAAEFALIAPVLISFVIGISQVGKLFYASADMKNALASGARAASVWPVPENPEILAVVNDRLARTKGVAAAEATIPARGVDSAGNGFIDIAMTYKVPLDFIFFGIGPVTLSDSRRVYIQMDGVTPATPAAPVTTPTTPTVTDPPVTDPPPEPTGPTWDPEPVEEPDPVVTPTTPDKKDKHNHGNCKKNC